MLGKEIYSKWKVARVEENVGVREDLRASLPGLLRGCVHVHAYGGASWCLSHPCASPSSWCPCVSAALSMLLLPRVGLMLWVPTLLCPSSSGRVLPLI